VGTLCFCCLNAASLCLPSLSPPRVVAPGRQRRSDASYSPPSRTPDRRHISTLKPRSGQHQAARLKRIACREYFAPSFGKLRFSCTTKVTKPQR
jgi:hypothetical protein